MTVRIYTLNPAAPEFEFDITTEVTKNLKWTPTKRAVENVGNIADHVYREPFTLTSDGFVAVTPISPRTYQPIPSISPAVLISMQNALEEMAAKEDLVTLACDLYTGPVAITSLAFAKGVQDGYSLRAAISFSEIQIAIPQTTQVNPSRLRAKVKKRAPTKGGAKATEQAQLRAAEGLFGGKASHLHKLVY